MKLQLWTTVDGEPEDMLGEIEVSDEDWYDAQSSGADSLRLIQDLAAEVHGGCD